MASFLVYGRIIASVESLRKLINKDIFSYEKIVRSIAAEAVTFVLIQK